MVFIIITIIKLNYLNNFDWQVFIIPIFLDALQLDWTFLLFYVWCTGVKIKKCLGLFALVMQFCV